MNKMPAMPKMKKSPMDDMPGMGSKPSLKDTPDRHAFVMAGQKTLFLCHLTMVNTEMPNHMYELVLEATLSRRAMQQYLADLKEHPKATYFIGNSAKDLMTLPEINIGARISFKADIWRGIPPKHHYKVWPWQKQKPIIPDVTVNIDRVVRFRHFNFAIEYPVSMTYFLFGKGSEAHLYHYQTCQPDFDQVVSLAHAPGFLPQEQLQSGALIGIPLMGSTPVPCSNPLTKKTYQVQYEGIGDFGLHEIKIDRSLWFSTAITNSINPCPGK
jgi:hypothetical protein